MQNGKPLRICVTRMILSAFIEIALREKDCGKEGEKSTMGRRERKAPWEGGREKDYGKEREKRTMGRRAYKGSKTWSSLCHHNQRIWKEIWELGMLV